MSKTLKNIKEIKCRVVELLTHPIFIIKIIMENRSPTKITVKVVNCSQK